MGDEDQSIYSWRGADIRNILEFEKDFPEAKIIRLEQNYRSTQNILQGRVGGGGEQRQAQGQEPVDLAPGRLQDRLLRSSGRRKRSAVCRRLHLEIPARSRRPGRETRAAVLYRTNSQSRLYEEAMRRYSLKYHVVGGFSFYERAEIKDMISYLKVIHNPDDSISLLRVINTPVRGIGKTSIETLERVALETGLSLWGAIGGSNQAPASAAARGGCSQDISPTSSRTGAPSCRARLRSDLEETAAGEAVREDEDIDLSPVEDDTDFSPDNFSFDFSEPSQDSAGVPPALERAISPLADEVEAGRLHDSRQDAGATSCQHC